MDDDHKLALGCCSWADIPQSKGVLDFCRAKLQSEKKRMLVISWHPGAVLGQAYPSQRVFWIFVGR